MATMHREDARHVADVWGTALVCGEVTDRGSAAKTELIRSPLSLWSLARGDEITLVLTSLPSYQIRGFQVIGALLRGDNGRGPNLAPPYPSSRSGLSSLKKLLWLPSDVVS